MCVFSLSDFFLVYVSGSYSSSFPFCFLFFYIICEFYDIFLFFCVMGIICFGLGRLFYCFVFWAFLDGLRRIKLRVSQVGICCDVPI